MKKLFLVTLIFSSIAVFSCKQTSENQGYDSGPTTKSEQGSHPSGGGEVRTDTTSTTNTENKEGL